MQLDRPIRSLAIELHDVSPYTLELTERLAAIVASVDYSAPLTLLVVPFHHDRTAITDDPTWRRWVDARLSRGDEIALHGWRHRDDGPDPTNPLSWFARRILTAGEAEFSAIGYVDAHRRIEKGLTLLQRCGWHAAGFVPPAWQMNIATRALLADFPFEYTSTRTQMYDLPSWRMFEIDTFGFSVRSGWRRCVSNYWNGLKVRLTHSESALRVALHPADALHPEMLSVWLRLLRELLSDRIAVTASHLIAGHHALGATADFAARPSLLIRDAR